MPRSAAATAPTTSRPRGPAATSRSTTRRRRLPRPRPTPTPTPLVTAATGCPTIADPQGLTDKGVLSGPTGSYRVCSLPNRVIANTRLPKIAGLVYNLPGRVDVGYDNGPTPLSTTNTKVVTQPNGTSLTLTADSNVTLTIDPGVIIYANSGPSWLNINRGNKINAVGTPTAPIIFTSRDNILGLNTDTSSGQWGGVVLSGRAQVTDCAAPAATPGTAACERQTEGAVDPALYGGANNSDNSGQMSYVQIRYSGFILSSNVELQSLTPLGRGRPDQDRPHHVVQQLGRRRRVLRRPCRDEILHLGRRRGRQPRPDTGVKGNFQYVIVAQRPNSGPAGADSIIEADSDNGLLTDNPRHNVTVANFTFIDRVANAGSDQASILIRGAADYTLVNGVLVNTVANPCLRLSQAQTASTTQSAAIDEIGAPIFKSVAFSGCDTTRKYIGSNGVTDAQVQTIFGSGANNNNDAFTSTLTSLFVNGANETAVRPSTRAR